MSGGSQWINRNSSWKGVSNACINAVIVNYFDNKALTIACKEGWEKIAKGYRHFSE